MSDTGRRCPRCDCPDGHEQCDHCKVCPHAVTARLCPQVHRVPHDAHDCCPGWMPDDGTGPDEAPAATPLEEARATAEDLRYRIRRAREALAEDEPVDRCPSCEHRWDIHADDGCWHTVAQGRTGRDLVCACRVTGKEKP